MEPPRHPYLFTFIIEVELTHKFTLISSVQHSDFTSLYIMHVHYKCSYNLSPYNAIVKIPLAVFPMLYLLSLGLTPCITESLYLLLPFTHDIQSILKCILKYKISMLVKPFVLKNQEGIYLVRVYSIMI